MEGLYYTAKLVLYKDGKFFGPGVMTLLELVNQTRSLSKASKKMSLAYTKALRMIKTAEQNLGYPLLFRQVGGASGGGSELTPNARILMERYRQFEREVKTAADHHFHILERELDRLK